MKISVKMAAFETNQSNRTHLDYYNLFTDDTYYKTTLTENSDTHKCYESNVDKSKNLSVEQYLLMIVPYLSSLINDQKDETNKQKIQLYIHISFIQPNHAGLCLYSYINSDIEDIRTDVETNQIIHKLFASFLNNYNRNAKALRNESNSMFKSIGSISYHICKF